MAEPRSRRALFSALPFVVGVLFLAGWQAVVSVAGLPPYFLPGPLTVASAMVDGWGTLWPSLLVTLEFTLAALTAALVGGGLLAIVFSQSRWIEASLFPYAVILQVTPIVAIAPLILIYTRSVDGLGLLICAWIVAFFPILSSTTLGLRSADPNLVDLMRLYRAGRFQVLWRLRLPAAMPYALGGLRIAGGLSLIGAVVAEFAAGTSAAGSGLAYRILESGYRLDTPRMYAALVLLSLTGIAIYAVLSAVSWLVLHRWHESAIHSD